jgi:carbon-monoxide dehydrogenase medium subunit
MYTAPFEYHTPGSVDEAIALLTRHGDDAKLLAGGHSLIPVMKLRLAQPAHLIDLRKVTTLEGVREERNAIVVGAMTTYAAVEASHVVRGKQPIHAEPIRLIGDTHVRNRGTVGGSLAHADPGADLPAVALALDAELRIRGSGGERTVRAAEFFVGLMSTALTPADVLTEIRFPIPAGDWGGAYEKYKHPASGYALVGVAAIATRGGGNNIDSLRVAITGLGVMPTRATVLEKALNGQPMNDEAVDAAALHIADGIDIREDLHASRAYRANLASVCARRALRRALRS